MKAATVRWWSRSQDALYLTGWALFLFALATAFFWTRPWGDLYRVLLLHPHRAAWADRQHVERPVATQTVRRSVPPQPYLVRRAAGPSAARPLPC